MWVARNRREDTDTAAARAGLAWPTGSAPTWDARFSARAASLAWTRSVDGDAVTAKRTTRQGRTWPSPRLECIETLRLVRITFNAWYDLPLVLEIRDDRGHLVPFGHGGVRITAGHHARPPGLAVACHDHAGSSGRRTPALRGTRIAGGDGDQVELAEGTRSGAHVDEIHLDVAGAGRLRQRG